MSKQDQKKTAEQQWKTESMRQQRRERLAEMKAKDGGKKPIAYKNTKTTVISSLIVAVLIIAALLWGASSMGLFHRHIKAVTVGDESYTAAEVNYYYRTLLSSYGIDPNTADGQSALNGPSGFAEGQTVKAFILEAAAGQIQEVTILSQYAREQGLSLEEDEYTQIDAYIEQLRTSATQAGVTMDTYLASLYGKGMNQEILREIFTETFLADKGVVALNNAFLFDDQEIDEKYLSDPDRYDVANYRVLYLAADIPSEATDAQRAEAMEAAKADAEEMAGLVTDEDSFKALAVTYAPEDDKASYEESDLTLVTNRKKTNISPLVVANWVFAEEREAEDVEVVESTSGYYVVYFINREKPTYRNVDVRHILISANEATASEQEISAAEEKANDILEAYLSGDQTEDAFAELAQEHSEDGNADRGGIYENVAPGQMVEAFNNWIFDEARQPGDTDIVQTNFGFHVMYFSAYGDEEAWRLSVTGDLQTDAYQDYMEQAKEAAPFEMKGLGMRLVG